MLVSGWMTLLITPRTTLGPVSLLVGMDILYSWDIHKWNTVRGCPQTNQRCLCHVNFLTLTCQLSCQRIQQAGESEFREGLRWRLCFIQKVGETDLCSQQPNRTDTQLPCTRPLWKEWRKCKLRLWTFLCRKSWHACCLPTLPFFTFMWYKVTPGSCSVHLLLSSPAGILGLIMSADMPASAGMTTGDKPTYLTSRQQWHCCTHIHVCVYVWSGAKY